MTVSSTRSNLLGCLSPTFVIAINLMGDFLRDVFNPRLY